MFSLVCFSTYLKIQKVKRSARTRLKPGERPNVSSSQPSPVTFRRAWWVCTIDEPNCRSPSNTTSLLHMPLHILVTQTSNDPIGDPSSRSGNRSASSSIIILYVSDTHVGHISRLSQPVYCEEQGIPYASEISRPL